ncbi:hypothetical protein AJ79_05728 [Helicocarpus griseus UAMH5409]|uniref:Uncharacterized protein n=1 Tax=Helicocarpus griseus UAMH5409 TaxID=1447875 RepID=A0A2B7XJU3_9EURO|nr:hypothetical protein AJ79_05728 [Helicocarpus griseus UAMH5409]
MLALKSTLPFVALILLSIFCTLTCSLQTSHDGKDIVSAAGLNAKRAGEQPPNDKKQPPGDKKKPPNDKKKPPGDKKKPGGKKKKPAGDQDACPAERKGRKFGQATDPQSKKPKLKWTKDIIDKVKKHWKKGGKKGKDPKKQDKNPKNKDKKPKQKPPKKGEEPKPNKTKRDTSLEQDDKSDMKTLAKRTRNLFFIQDLYNNAMMRVATDHSSGFAFDYRRPLQDQSIATRDLSGCTVAVIASPYAVIMLHVWERRARNWLTDPNGPEQQRMDREFQRQGRSLLRRVLAGFGSGQNGWQGYFPEHLTRIEIVGPAVNPEYELPGYFTNPAYARNVPAGIIYPRAMRALQTMLCNEMTPNRCTESSRLHTYRRRYSNDPFHGMDDVEYIVVVPANIGNGEIWLNMIFDANNVQPILRMR